jgi:predicted dehydrogenase
LVHKSTHHFDLVNFWLGTQPSRVFAYGDLKFYGRSNAEKRGVTKFYSRCLNNEAAKDDPFAIDLESDETLRELYLNAEKDSGYIRDRSVFADDISIEDTMGVLAKYKNGAILTYSLNAYMPWEGFNVCINGSKGRIELNVRENTYINAGGEKENEGTLSEASLKVCPMFDDSYTVEVMEKEGGHGGGDPLLLNDIFGIPEPDPFNRAASHFAGAMSILTGIAANKSIASGLEIKIDDLVKF